MRLLAVENWKGEHLGYFEELAEEHGVEVEYRRLWKGDSLDGALEESELLVFLGGPMSVNDEGEYPYLAEEKRVIRQAVAENKPVLGICLGAQLIASALGARVYPGEVKELGWYRLLLTEAGAQDSVFSALPKEHEVFQWHGETFELPRGAVLLAGSELYPNQAFRVGRSYALQYHLEVTLGMIEDWVRSEPEVRERVLEDAESRVERLNRLAEVFFTRWLKLAGL